MYVHFVGLDLLPGHGASYVISCLQIDLVVIVVRQIQQFWPYSYKT